MKHMQIFFNFPGPLCLYLIHRLKTHRLWIRLLRINSNVCCSASFWLSVFLLSVCTLCSCEYVLQTILSLQSFNVNTLFLAQYAITIGVKLSENKWIERFWQLSAIPSGQFDDVSWLDEAAQLVPDRNCNAPGLIRHFTWANLMSIFCFSHSPWQKKGI